MARIKITDAQMTALETAGVFEALEGDELEPSYRFCTCCERELKGKVAWLELDQRTDTYHDRGGVPEDNSQGWFPFGMACARKKLKEHAKASPTPPLQED